MAGIVILGEAKGGQDGPNLSHQPSLCDWSILVGDEEWVRAVLSVCDEGQCHRHWADRHICPSDSDIHASPKLIAFGAFEVYFHHGR